MLAGIAYALLAASTTPFTCSANIVTGVPIILLGVLVVLRWPPRPRPGPRRPVTEGGGGTTAHPWRAWVILFAVLVAWELAEYAARGSRADHPTFSSMLDAVDRYFVLKAVVFFLWLALGAAIVKLGGRRRPRSAGAHAGPVPSVDQS